MTEATNNTSGQPQSAPPEEREAAVEAAYAAVVEGGWSSVKEMGVEMFQAGAAWQRTQAAGVPDGYALVPIEPTPAMIDVALKWGTKKSEWEELLAAAPTPEPVRLTEIDAELINELRRSAAQIELAGHAGWGNTMAAAADALEDALSAPPPEPASPWISVDDRLPEIDMAAPEYSRRANVIAWRAGWKEPRQLRFVSNGYAKTEKGRAPRWEELSGCLAFSLPTHWAPLPSAPEQPAKEVQS